MALQKDLDTEYLLRQVNKKLRMINGQCDSSLILYFLYNLSEEIYRNILAIAEGKLVRVAQCEDINGWATNIIENAQCKADLHEPHITKPNIDPPENPTISSETSNKDQVRNGKVKPRKKV